MKTNPVGWFEIYVQDLPRAKKFYEAVFDGQLSPLMKDEHLEMLSFPMDMTTLGCAGALCKMEGIKPGGGGTLIYFSSEDCSIEAGRVAAAGGRIHLPKQSIGEYGFIALAVDTEGNMIGIHSRK